MALKDILEVIAAESEKEAKAIRLAAEAAYTARMEAAELRVVDTRARILAEAERSAQQEKARQLHRVRLENQRQLVQVQETAFLAAVQRAQEIVSSLRQRPDYKEILSRLVVEAMANYDEPAIVVVHPDDVDLTRTILEAHEIKPHSIETLNGMGPGVIVRSVDGRIVTENTLESRLQRSLSDLRPLLVDLLSANHNGGRISNEIRD